MVDPLRDLSSDGPATGFSAGCLRSALPPRACSVRQLPAARAGFAGPGPGREIVGADGCWGLNFLHLQTHTHVDPFVSPGGPFHLTRAHPVTREFRSFIAARSSLRTHLSTQNFKFRAWSSKIRRLGSGANLCHPRREPVRISEFAVPPQLPPLLPIALSSGVVLLLGPHSTRSTSTVPSASESAPPGPASASARLAAYRHRSHGSDRCCLRRLSAGPGPVGSGQKLLCFKLLFLHCRDQSPPA